VVNFSIGRQISKDFSVEAAFVGRYGKDQLTRRDLAATLNLVDPDSGMDYFTAATQLIAAAEAAGLAGEGDTSMYTGLASIPYWENLFPDAAGDGLTATQRITHTYMRYYPDHITSLYILDQIEARGGPSRLGPYAYFSPQYDSLGSIATVGRSNYSAAQVTLRKRMSHGFQFDLNYTWSQSKDDGSQSEGGGSVFGNFSQGGYSGYLINSWDDESNYGISDYDINHQVNFNWIWDLPFGEGRAVAGDASGLANQIIGDWSVSGLVRWTSGFPFNVYNCRSCWATNWNLQGNAELVTPGVFPEMGTTVNAVDDRPSPFVDAEAALEKFRFVLPGEQGLRNELNGDGFFTIDVSFAKAFQLGFGNSRIRFRWDIFNLTNTPSYDVYSLNAFPDRSGFGRYDGSFATCDALAGRCMQVALRFEF
jgi:hypothetical protein